MYKRLCLRLSLFWVGTEVNGRLLVPTLPGQFMFSIDDSVLLSSYHHHHHHHQIIIKIITIIIIPVLSQAKQKYFKKNHMYHACRYYTGNPFREKKKPQTKLFVFLYGEQPLGSYYSTSVKCPPHPLPGVTCLCQSVVHDTQSTNPPRETIMA